MPRNDVESKPGGAPIIARRIVGALFNGALWAMAIALVFSKWTWLEMRFNVGWILIGAWVVLFALILWRVEKPLGLAFSIANALTCACVFFAFSGGIAGIQMIPASLLREGLHQIGWSIVAVNAGMLVFSAVCLVTIAVLERAFRTSVAEEADTDG